MNEERKIITPEEFYQIMYNYAHSFSPPLQIWWPNGIRRVSKWAVPWYIEHKLK
jgi:hypothetical protein